MLFFSSKLRLYCANLLCLCFLVSTAAHADSQKITEVAGVSLTPQGQVMAQKIKRVFSDAPYMLDVANCESTGLIHREKGSLIKNRQGSSAQGVFQVLMSRHRAEMQKMGLDPNNTEDYLEYVRHLYDTFGLKPWAESKKCWQKQIRTQRRG